MHQPKAIIQTLLHSETWYLLLCTTRWFAMRLDLLCAIFVIILTFACMLLRDGKKTLLLLPPVFNSPSEPPGLSVQSTSKPPWFWVQEDPFGIEVPQHKSYQSPSNEWPERPQCMFDWCHEFVPLLDLGAGDVGLALSYAISIVGIFQWGVRQSAIVETLVSLRVVSKIRARAEIWLYHRFKSSIILLEVGICKRVIGIHKVGTQLS